MRKYLTFGVVLAAFLSVLVSCNDLQPKAPGTPSAQNNHHKPSNLYRDEYGNEFYLPPLPSFPREVPSGGNLAPQATVPSCFLNTGVHHLLYTKSTVTDVNWVSATIAIPDNSAILSLREGEAPYIMSGGWSSTHLPLDAGLGYYYNSHTGFDWAPFMRSASIEWASLKTKDAQGNPLTLHLKGGQTIHFEFWNTNDEFVIEIGPTEGSSLTWIDYDNNYQEFTSNETYLFTHPIPSGATGWSVTGQGETLKAETSIAQPAPFTMPSGNTQITGIEWNSIRYGVRDASGNITAHDWTIASQGTCAYPEGIFNITSLGSNSEGIDIQFVGPAVAQVTPTSFVYRGKPGDVFNQDGSDVVKISNAGPDGSLLYWCQQDTSGVCDPTLSEKYANNRPLETSSPADTIPIQASCPDDISQAKDGDFNVEYKVDADDDKVQKVTVTIKCTQITLTWFQADKTFDGPNDLCQPVAVMATIQSNVDGITTADLQLAIDGNVLTGDNVSIYNPDPNQPYFFHLIGNNHCNYSEGQHTLTVKVLDPEDTSQLLTTISDQFTITDNRWTVALVNSTNNCPNNPGFTLSFTATASGEEDQSVPDVPPGSAGKIFMRASEAYTIVATADGGGSTSAVLTFPDSWGASLPLNIGYSNFSGVNAQAAYGISLVCPSIATQGLSSRLEPHVSLSHTLWQTIGNRHLGIRQRP